MLIDLRYHLITVVAIFLALAVGIVTGSAFLAGSSVKGLESEFAKLRAENRAQQQTIEDLRSRNERNIEFAKSVAPWIVNKQLSWRRVAIIQTGDYSEATQNVRSVLEDAGARVVSVTTLSHFDEESARDRVIRSLELITGEAEYSDPVERVTGIIARSVAAGSNLEALEIMERKGLLNKAGEYDRQVLHFVIVGGAKQRGSKRASRVDLLLIDELKAAGVMTVVGAEPLEVGTSYIPAYHRKAIPTVDNVDQPMGQVALIFAVAGETGNFGVKRTADRAVPVYLESGQWRSGFPR